MDMTSEMRLSTMLYRSLERLSIAIDSCARIGFEESKPTTNATHGQVWQDLNDAQKDAKFKLKHYRDAAISQVSTVDLIIADPQKMVKP